MNPLIISLLISLSLGIYIPTAFAVSNCTTAVNEQMNNFQSAIDSVVSIIMAHEKRTASEQDCNAAVEKLLTGETNTVSELLVQTLIYRCKSLDEYRDRASRILVWLLLQRTSENQILDTIIPVYSQETDDIMIKQAKMVLDSVALKDGSKPNFDAFVPYLK